MSGATVGAYHMALGNLFNVDNAEVTPNSAGGGVYLDEADIQEPDRQVDVYGAKH